MTPLNQAKDLVLQQAHSFSTEKIMLDEAVGRVLTESIIADRDYPPFNRATMDGIAINSADWNNGVRSFILIETLFAGKIFTKELKAGECYKIMTGAAVPPSANTVIRREDIEENENRLTVTVSSITAGQNIAAKGSDTKEAAVVIKAPHLVKPGTITALASLGYAEVTVAKLPTVSIISTGDEVKHIDEPVNEVQVRNSNAHLLKAFLQQWKIKPVSCEHVIDDATLLRNAVEKQLQNDVLILSGAVSAGDADFVPEVLTNLGAVKIFHKVAIRPGKPIWFGKFENGPIVFALPGNPFSTFVTFKLFIETFLQKCFGLEDTRILYLPFGGSRVKKTNLDEFFPVRLAGKPTIAELINFNTSGDVTAVMMADALAMQPINQVELKQGNIISCIAV